MNNWKSISLILTGVLIGCAGNAAHSAHADSPGSGGSSVKCLGPSVRASGVEEDLNALISEGYDPFLATDSVVCGRR